MFGRPTVNSETWANARAIACPFCGAEKAEPCISVHDKRVMKAVHHSARYRAAEKEQENDT